MAEKGEQDDTSVLDLSRGSKVLGIRGLVKTNGDSESRECQTSAYILRQHLAPQFLSQAARSLFSKPRMASPSKDVCSKCTEDA
jgi:hypothetical protein